MQGATFCPSDPNRMYLYVDVGGPYRSDVAGPGGTVTLLTDATAPKGLAAGRTIIENGHEFTLFEDKVTTFFLK